MDSIKTKNQQRKIIFFGNGDLATYALAVLSRDCRIVFHAKTKEDLAEVKRLKRENPELHGVLASFGVIIKSDVLDLFEPEGILNIHPSLLPAYRGASPIESAILDGANNFSVSVMKLVGEMDAGPIYYQATIPNLPLDKDTIYKTLAEVGAEWIVQNIDNLPEAASQDESKATFCGKFDKSMSFLTPETDTAEQTWRKIVAFQKFPKPKYTFYGVNCIILAAHILQPGEKAVLPLPCANGTALGIDKLQPEGRKPMDAKAFLNGYSR